MLPLTHSLTHSATANWPLESAGQWPLVVRTRWGGVWKRGSNQTRARTVLIERLLKPRATSTNVLVTRVTQRFFFFSLFQIILWPVGVVSGHPVEIEERIFAKRKKEIRERRALFCRKRWQMCSWKRWCHDAGKQHVNRKTELQESAELVLLSRKRKKETCSDRN